MPAADLQPHWSSGEVIPVRHVQDGVVRFAEAAIVVEDQGDRLAIFTPVGAAMQWSRVEWETGAFSGPHAQRRHTTEVLRIVELGDQHMTSHFFTENFASFICWYVDLTEPFRRGGGGLVTFDRSLDIVVGPDRRWRWKDEDHFAHIQRFGWITPDRAAELRSEGERVISRIEAGAPPFDGSWLNWRPDPAWALPELPNDWASVPS
jgi:hypothetical protein